MGKEGQLQQSWDVVLRRACVCTVCSVDSHSVTRVFNRARHHKVSYVSLTPDSAESFVVVLVSWTTRRRDCGAVMGGSVPRLDSCCLSLKMPFWSGHPNVCQPRCSRLEAVRGERRDVGTEVP